MTLDKADELVKETDYYRLAAHKDINPINLGDASAFFIEGYNQAIEDAIKLYVTDGNPEVWLKKIKNLIN